MGESRKTRVVEEDILWGRGSKRTEEYIPWIKAWINASMPPVSTKWRLELGCNREDVDRSK